MIASILWKEYREHRSIWLALAILGVLVLVAVPVIFPPDHTFSEQARRESLGTIAIVFAWTYGLVCGSMLLAGERENGTEPFIDGLPVNRFPLWVAKFLAGGLFLALQVLLLGIIVVANGYGLSRQWAVNFLALAVAGFVGLGWGMLFSARAKNVLNAIGMALLAQVFLLPLLYPLLYILGAMVVMPFGIPFPPQLPWLPILAIGLFMPLPASAWFYSKLDRERWLDSSQPISSTTSSGIFLGWRSLVWLSWQQARVLAVWLCVIAFAAGLTVRGAGLIAWPIYSLLVGVLCGVTVFLGEQGGAFRFLGEQRYPPGRIWLVKMGMRLAIALVAVLILMLPAAAYTAIKISTEDQTNQPPVPLLARMFSSPIVGTLAPGGVFLFGWVLYGFAAGHLAGMIFRKPLVALIVGLGLGVLLVCVWAPALIAGGLAGWQVLGVPVVLLLTCRWVMRPWLSDRMVTVTGVGRVASGWGMALALLALGLGYRMIEIPNVPEPDDLEPFIAGIPSPEHNEGGRLTRTACAQLLQVIKASSKEPGGQGGGPGGAPGAEPVIDPRQQLEAVLRTGWPDNDKHLATWMDDVFRDDWHKKLAEAAKKPTGVLEDPRLLTYRSAFQSLEGAQEASRLLAVRGLQMQAKNNDPAAFVENLRAGLALARTLQRASPVVAASYGQWVERNLLRGLERWLEKLRGEPQLLARSLRILQHHQNSLPSNYREQELVEYVLARNSLQNPEQWMYWWHEQRQPHEMAQLQMQLLSSAWLLPWEQERQDRMLRLVFWGRETMTPAMIQLSRFIVPIPHNGKRHLDKGRLRRELLLRGTTLHVALRLYQARTGKPARRLEDLKTILPRLPLDPYTGKPFGYRLSKGEKIHWPQPEAPPGAVMAGADEKDQREIPADWGILWSAGEDGIDDGGKRQSRGGLWDAAASPGEDRIILIQGPMP